MGRGAGRKIVQNAIFHGKRRDKKILKVKILLSRNFVVMAQAPTETNLHKLAPSRGGHPCSRQGVQIWEVWSSLNMLQRVFRQYSTTIARLRMRRLRTPTCMWMRDRERYGLATALPIAEGVLGPLRQQILSHVA